MTYEQAASVLKMELSKCRTDFYKDRRDALRLAIVCLECFAQNEVMDVDIFYDDEGMTEAQKVEVLKMHNINSVMCSSMTEGIHFMDPA